MKYMKRLRAFLLNGLILTITSLLMSSISVWFNVYLGNKIGNEMMGVFQLIMSVYGFSITLATGGINLATTRLVAEEMGRSAHPNLKKILRKCLLYSISFGTVTAVLLYQLAPAIGLQMLQNDQTVLPLKTLAISLPCIAMSSVLSGYFTAVRRVVKNASIRIAEQFVKIFLTIVGLTVLSPGGLEQTCLCMVWAGVISEIFSFLFSFIMYQMDARRYKKCDRASQGITRRMFGIALPVAMSANLRSGILTVKNLLVPIQLRKFGVSESEAYAAFGAIHGIVLPVILFPSAFLFSFCDLIVPELAECFAVADNLKDNIRINYMVTRMSQMTLLFSMGVAGIMFCFSTQVGELISSSDEIGLYADYIRLFALIIPIMYFDHAVDAMLKGLDEQRSSMRYNIIDSTGTLILVWFLLPVSGIQGYVFVLYMSEIINFALSLHRLIKVTSFRVNLADTILKPALCIGLAVALPALGIQLMPSLDAPVFLIASSAFLYLILLCVTGCLTPEDIKWLKSIFAK